MIKNIIFDLDSTLVTIEGLDWVAEQKKLGGRVKEITTLAMNGDLDFAKALNEKLNLIKPSKKDIELMGQAYLDNITSGVVETIKKLKEKYNLFIISGAFDLAVYTLADYLGIKRENTYSNHINWDENGNFMSIDLNNDLTKQKGKLNVIAKNFTKNETVFVGDSVTDLEAKSVVKLFIGFGGVVVRPKVKQNAEYFINDFIELLKLMEHTTI